MATVLIDVSWEGGLPSAADPVAIRLNPLATDGWWRGQPAVNAGVLAPMCVASNQPDGTCSNGETNWSGVERPVMKLPEGVNHRQKRLEDRHDGGLADPAVPTPISWRMSSARLNPAGPAAVTPAVTRSCTIGA